MNIFYLNGKLTMTNMDFATAHKDYAVLTIIRDYNKTVSDPRCTEI